MADKKFSEFDLGNNDNPIELVGLQGGTNVRTGLVSPVYKDAEGGITTIKLTADTVDAGKVITNNIQSKTGSKLYFEAITNQGVQNEVLHTGNLSLIPTPTIDHGALTGLSDDDHQQYAKKAGDEFTGYLRAALDPVADRDVVPFKYLKDELAKGAFRGVQWKYGGSTAAAPASGYMKIVTTTGQKRNILLNDVDANGYTRSALAILAGDTIVVSTSPTAFARYMITAKAIDNGTYWTIPCTRTDTQGSQTPPALETVLTVTATFSGTDVVEEYIPISQKGAPDGVAPLDSTGHISSEYLNISGFHFIGGWDAAPGILPPDGADGDMYLITNEGTLTVVPPQTSNGIAVPTLCLEGQELVYQVSKDVWYLFSANTAINDTLYVKLSGSTMTGHLTVPAGASGSQVRRASETDTLLAGKAPLSSPALTGIPTAPTAPAGTNTTQLATTGFVKDAITTATNGQGNVVGPASSVDNYIPQWDGITGKLLKGGIPTTTFATPASVALKADKTYVDSQDALKANLDSPVFTGNPTAPTQLSTDNSTKLATTAFVKSAVSAAGGGDVSGPSSSVVDYLPQWADGSGKLLKNGIPISTFATPADVALKADKTYVDSQDTLKANLDSPTFTGIPAAPTAAANTNTTQLATTAHVFAGLATKASLASPAFTGTPTAPTAGAGTNSTQIATTAFVAAELVTKAPLNSPALTGVPTAPTASVGTNTTQLATTAFVLANSGGGGDVTGPASATADAIALFNEATGKIIKAGPIITTSATDTTAGRVLKVGDFGLGYTAGGGLVDFNTVIWTGFSEANGFESQGAALNWPSTGLVGTTPVWFNLQTSSDEANGRISQIATECYATVPGVRQWIRTKHDADWEPWVEVWTTSNLVKTASATDTTVGRMLQVGAQKAQLGADVAGTVSPTFTGVPKAPTFPINTGGDGLATMAYANAEADYTATSYVAAHNTVATAHTDLFAAKASINTTPKFINIVDKFTNKGFVTGAVTINPVVDGGDVSFWMTGDTTVTFDRSGISFTDESVVFSVEVLGNFIVTWPTDVLWPDGVIPAHDSRSLYTFQMRRLNGADIYIFGGQVGSNYVAATAQVNQPIVPAEDVPVVQPL